MRIKAKGFARLAASSYSTLSKDNVNIAELTDRASFDAAVNRFRKEYFKRAGLNGLKPEFMAESVYPAIAKSEERSCISIL